MTLRCTAHLIQEHRHILRIAKVLQAMADQAEKGRRAETGDVEQLLDFLHRFADEHHQGKEEAVLFPALRNTDHGKPGGPLHALMFEHEQERSLAGGLENSVRNRNAADFSYYARRLSRTLLDHIHKEDHVLFELIEKYLNRDLDARLAEEMAALDASLRPGTLEDFVRIAEELEWKHLGKAEQQCE